MVHEITITDKIQHIHNADVHPGYSMAAVKTEHIIPLVYQLLTAMDEGNTGRTVGAVLSTIIRGTLDRLNDPQNEIKGGWEGMTQEERQLLVMEEISEFRGAVLHNRLGGEDNRYPEGCDVLATMGMFLQLLEAP